MNTHQDRPSPRPRHPLMLALGIVLLMFAVPLAIFGLSPLPADSPPAMSGSPPLTIGAASLAEAALFATAAWFTLSRERHPVGW